MKVVTKVGKAAFEFVKDCCDRDTWKIQIPCPIGLICYDNMSKSVSIYYYPDGRFKDRTEFKSFDECPLDLLESLKISVIENGIGKTFPLTKEYKLNLEIITGVTQEWKDMIDENGLNPYVFDDIFPVVADRDKQNPENICLPFEKIKDAIFSILMPQIHEGWLIIKNI